MKELEEARRARDELDKAIATMEAKQKDAAWPKDGDDVWTIATDGQVVNYNWDDDSFDIGALSIGNVFRTESDAQKELETRKTIAEFRAQPGRRKFDVEVDNWGADIRIGNGTIECDRKLNYDFCFSSTYFDSKTSAQAAVKAVGEDRLLAASKWLSMGE